MTTLMQTDGHARQLGTQTDGPALNFDDSIKTTSPDLICIGLGNNFGTSNPAEPDSERLRIIAETSRSALFSTGTDSNEVTELVKNQNQLKPLDSRTDFGVSTLLNDWHKPTRLE